MTRLQVRSVAMALLGNQLTHAAIHGRRHGNIANSFHPKPKRPIVPYPNPSPHIDKNFQVNAAGFNISLQCIRQNERHRHAHRLHLRPDKRTILLRLRERLDHRLPEYRRRVRHSHVNRVVRDLHVMVAVAGAQGDHDVGVQEKGGDAPVVVRGW